MRSIAGKTALVTGASSGIGRACVELLAAAGVRVIAAARRKDRLEALRLQVDSTHGEGRCRILALDVRDRDAVFAAVTQIDEDFPEGVDILVNNAGLAAGLSSIASGSFDHWDRMIETNLTGLLNVTRAVLPGMQQRGRGHVVNIGSIAGREVYPSGNVYCATKHAVRALNKAMRLDLLGTGIRVTTVDPGMVDTEFSHVRFDGDQERVRAVYTGLTPLHAEDVADAVVWAVSRPAHVNVEEILLMPSAQASATAAYRSP